MLLPLKTAVLTCALCVPSTCCVYREDQKDTGWGDGGFDRRKLGRKLLVSKTKVELSGSDRNALRAKTRARSSYPIKLDAGDGKRVYVRLDGQVRAGKVDGEAALFKLVPTEHQEESEWSLVESLMCPGHFLRVAEQVAPRSSTQRAAEQGHPGKLLRTVELQRGRGSESHGTRFRQVLLLSSVLLDDSLCVLTGILHFSSRGRIGTGREQMRACELTGGRVPFGARDS